MALRWRLEHSHTVLRKDSLDMLVPVLCALEIIHIKCFIMSVTQHSDCCCYQKQTDCFKLATLSSHHSLLRYVWARHCVIQCKLECRTLSFNAWSIYLLLVMSVIVWWHTGVACSLLYSTPDGTNPGTSAECILHYVPYVDFLVEQLTSV